MISGRGVLFGAIFCAPVLLAALARPAGAQPAPPAGTGPPGDFRAPPPLLAPDPFKPAPQIEFQLPPLAPPAGAGRLSGAARIHLVRFRIVGSTVFSEDELRALVAQYEGREIGNEELEDARRRLTAHYVAQGYINSGALIPDQDVGNGIVTLQIVEGRLSEIAVTGKNRFAPGFIRERVAPPAGAPLNLVPLQERLQILLQNPLIERIGAELGPGEQPGEAVLRLDVQEAPPYEAGYAFANNRSPSIGGDQHEFWFGARNLLGRGIGAMLRTGQTRGLQDYSFALSAPLTASDTRLLLRVDRTHSLVIEAPLRPLEIASRSSATEFGVSHPFLRTPQRELLLAAHYYRRDNATFFLGQPFGFTPGLADGRSSIRALRLTGDYVERGETQVFAARLTLRLGLDWDGATVNPGFPDSLFTVRLMQLQWAKRLSEAGNQLLLRFDLQDANGSLLPSEKFSIGGMQSVRGYRENLLVKDRGWSGSLEYRHPVERWLAGSDGAAPEIGKLQLAAFVDAGRAADDLDTATARKRISSVGAGLLWEPVQGAQLQLYLARALTRIDFQKPSLQDRGVHFRFAVQQFF